jgi:hypothetical protein
MDLKSINNNLYTVIVAGDVDLNEYDANKIVKPYIAYKYNDRHEIRQHAINIHKELINDNVNKPELSMLTDLLILKVQDIEEMTDEEYFESITKGMNFDRKTGDALISINPNGKYIELIDNNFFACKEWKENIELLKSYNQPINFNTGIDLRILNEEQCKALETLKIKKTHKMRTKQFVQFHLNIDQLI